MTSAGGRFPLMNGLRRASCTADDYMGLMRQTMFWTMMSLRVSDRKSTDFCQILSSIGKHNANEQVDIALAVARSERPRENLSC